ncbi:hypothetical protein K435DRAFT_805618 [Dendrothele bispora CBS 962.96]|uniref:F-box domain-containing protein n=1 Tax=Dendrothele bispora (strain CBS 962.96) TaxID=1314807 RepID=A0A4S8LAY7_DENBC|nr:hypothetical protein K435DRAFT_805618 [Dendrothele bispora CBS 962.96]
MASTDNNQRASKLSERHSKPRLSRSVQLNDGSVTCELPLPPASSSPTRPSSSRRVPTLLAPRIPQEIQERVIKFLGSDQTLRSCLLVCRSWVPTARSCLYECFGIEAKTVPEDDINNAIVVLQEGLDDGDLSTIGNLVSPEFLKPHATIHRRLSVVGDTCGQLSREWFLPLALSLSQFSAVRTLELSDLDWSDLLTSQAWDVFYRQSNFRSQVKSLFLGDVEMEAFDLLERVIAAFPLLEELEIFPAYLEDYTEDLIYSLDYPGDHSLSKHLNTNLYLPSSSLHTFIGDVSPGEFMLCPFYRWLTSSSFTGLNRIELGQISRNDIFDLVCYLKVAGGALKELKIGFRVVGDIASQKDTGRPGDDLDMFTSYGGVSANTGLVYLEISGLFVASVQKGDQARGFRCECWPVSGALTFYSTIQSSVLETLVLPVDLTPASVDPQTSNVYPLEDDEARNKHWQNWLDIDSFLTNRLSSLISVKFWAPRLRKTLLNKEAESIVNIELDKRGIWQFLQLNLAGLVERKVLSYI